jgi:hypothetical protein
MNSELARMLTQTFPRLFAHGDDIYPFRCGDGWYQLLSDLATQLVILESPETDLHVNQAKEKFGGLRFYTRVVLSAASQQVIEEAEARSFTICEACGAPGVLQRRNGWLRTRCANHAGLDDPSLQAMVGFVGMKSETIERGARAEGITSKPSTGMIVLAAPATAKNALVRFLRGVPCGAPVLEPRRAPAMHLGTVHDAGQSSA